MTKDRDYKRIVRSRAAKTGETYQQSQRALEREESSDDLAEPAPSEVDRSVGAQVAEFALRLADGKPTVPGPPWTKEMSELLRAALAAKEAATRPGAGDAEECLARELQQKFDEAAAAAAESATAWTPETYLEATVAGRLGVVRVAARQCRALLAQNPRDAVAREALALLESIAATIDASGPSVAT